MSVMLRILLLVCLLHVLPVQALDCVAPNPADSVALVEFDPLSQRLKLVARHDSLHGVLRRITAATGIEFIGDTGRCDDVTLELDDVELSRALAQLLAGRNYIVRAEAGPEGDPGAMRVWLLPSGDTDSLTEMEQLQHEFYRQLQGRPELEALAAQIKQLESEQSGQDAHAKP